MRSILVITPSRASRGTGVLLDGRSSGPAGGLAPVDSTQGGHGVGLYLAFSAAARLGGSIELTDVSEIKPRGTRAVLRLPLAREQTDAGRQGAASSNTEKQA